MCAIPFMNDFLIVFHHTIVIESYLNNKNCIKRNYKMYLIDCFHISDLVRLPIQST